MMKHETMNSDAVYVQVVMISLPLPLTTLVRHHSMMSIQRPGL